MSTDHLCPCGTSKAYNDCCGPLIAGKVKAKTPLELMRSRYTAFTQANVGYIKRTMTGKQLKTLDEEGTKSWAESVTWLKLTILNAPEVKPGGLRGTVEFKVSYKQDNELLELHELSVFKRENSTWYYGGEKALESTGEK